MEQRVQNEHLAGHLPTRLKGLDETLCGGIPFGVLTELVGPAGIGKTQVSLFHKYLFYSQFGFTWGSYLMSTAKHKYHSFISIFFTLNLGLLGDLI
jgi:archaellum biogenesis ATPase FlaH